MESIVKTGTGVVNSILGSVFPPKEIEQPVVIKEIIQDMNPGGRTFVRIAGASGAIAVMMSAYGAHGNLSIGLDKQIILSIFFLLPIDVNFLHIALTIQILKQYNTIQNLFIKLEIQNSITLAMNSYLPT